MKKTSVIKAGLVCCLILMYSLVNAQSEDSCSAKAPSEVAVGQQFNYTVTTTAKGDIVSSDFGKFEVLGGPSMGSSTSITMMNGKVDQSTTYTYTYVLSCDREGSFSIPGVTISVNGKLMKSNFIVVKVIKGLKSQPQQQQGGNDWFQFQFPQMPDFPQFSNPTQPQTTPKTDHVDANEKFDKGDLFVRASTTKLEAYQGEAIVVTHKLYIRPDINAYNVSRASMAQSDNFWMDELDIPYNAQRTTEAIKGKEYTVITIRQTAVYPRKTGKLTIPKLDITLVVGVPTVVNDPFWGQISTMKRKDVKLSSDDIDIKVRPLPGAHSDKTDVVGSFTMSSSLNRTELRTNEAATLMITISGNGNLQHITAEDLNIQFPKDCDVTYPRIVDHISSKMDNVTGSRTFKYTIIPRSEGTYLIPAATYTYYDYDSQTYKTLTSQDYQITVKQGNNSTEDTTTNKLPKNAKLYKISNPQLPAYKLPIPVKVENIQNPTRQYPIDATFDHIAWDKILC